jgi:hypothetical protein
VKINDLIYAQYIIYIYRQRGGKTPRPRCVAKGKNSPRVIAAPLVGLGKGQRTTLCGMVCAYAEDNPAHVQA